MSRRTERASHPEIPPATLEVARISELEATLAETRERLSRMEGEAAATSARIADLVNDRDAWRAQAERLAEASHPRPAGGLLARLFRRGV